MCWRYLDDLVHFSCPPEQFFLHHKRFWTGPFGIKQQNGVGSSLLQLSSRVLLSYRPATENNCAKRIAARSLIIHDYWSKKRGRGEGHSIVRPFKQIGDDNSEKKKYSAKSSLMLFMTFSLMWKDLGLLVTGLVRDRLTCFLMRRKWF